MWVSADNDSPNIDTVINELTETRTRGVYLKSHFTRHGFKKYNILFRVQYITYEIRPLMWFKTNGFQYFHNLKSVYHVMLRHSDYYE